MRNFDVLKNVILYLGLFKINITCRNLINLMHRSNNLKFIYYHLVVC
uniref:Uncharacterized protein n=1 Tax=Meloidogyne enterolobii TaxID=390850 RepID=A0A6V7YAA2_MELEN|nr:unnamed protein product [Meloidogyne enterolobii]